MPFHIAEEDPAHYQKLMIVQQHKCVGTYCLQNDGTEYGEPYCHFGFPMDLAARYQILFEEHSNSGVRATFVSKNDLRMYQHCKLCLMSWFADCNMQVVLDEEQVI